VIEHADRQPATGILFVNDEGTECGGIQYYGRRTLDGIEHAGYLTVDDYEQQESLRLGQTQGPGGSTKYLEFLDRPAWSLADLFEEMEDTAPDRVEEVQQRHAGSDGFGASRMRLSRESDGSVGLVLRDGRGQDRLRLVVPEDGDPTIEILDADGIPRSLLPD
jgi:hypothetical protein